MRAGLGRLRARRVTGSGARGERIKTRQNGTAYCTLFQGSLIVPFCVRADLVSRSETRIGNSSSDPRQMSSLRQATKDIKALSAVLATTAFERQLVAERRLLLQRGDGPALDAVLLLLDDCSKGLLRCSDLFEKALIQAASNSGDRSSFDGWWAAWVSSPVSTRLLHAMQTLMDGCIFQVCVP